MDVPHALDTREDEAIENRTRLLEDPHDGIRRFPVLVALAADAVSTGEFRVDAGPRALRHLGAEDYFHRLLPQPPGRERRAIVVWIVVSGADDAVALPAVAERERHRLFHEALLSERLRRGERNIAGR